MTRPFTVAIVGGNTVAQAVHLSLLPALADLWRVVAVHDADPRIAAELGRRCGATAAGSVADILADPAIDVIAVCTPPADHAELVIAACQAGKSAVLCDKPLSQSRAQTEAIARAAAASGTLIAVGTMHAFDPAWSWAAHQWERLGRTAAHVRSAIYLPANATFLDVATDLMPSAPASPAPDRADPLGQALRQAILNLGIHAIPLVRRLYPEIGQVRVARGVAPYGYSILAQTESQTLELQAFAPGLWPPSWTLDARAGEVALHMDFPPSYVNAGSARAWLHEGETSTRFQSAENGYVAQWRRLHARLTKTGPVDPFDDPVADALFALDLADRAVVAMEKAS